MNERPFDPTDARNAMRDQKFLLDLLSWVPGWVVMRQSEVDRLLNEAAALLVERNSARALNENALRLALAYGGHTADCPAGTNFRKDGNWTDEVCEATCADLRAALAAVDAQETKT